MSNEDNSLEAQLARWSESLAAIARTGLAFTQNLYERERYEEVLHVAADIKAAFEESTELRRERVTGETHQERTKSEAQKRRQEKNQGDRGRAAVRFRERLDSRQGDAAS